MRRLNESVYYFEPYQKHGQFAFQLVGEGPRFYPLSYTYQECIEDWCERKGYEFRRIVVQYGTYRGSGHFEFYRHSRSLKKIRRANRRKKRARTWG